VNPVAGREPIPAPPHNQRANHARKTLLPDLLPLRLLRRDDLPRYLLQPAGVDRLQRLEAAHWGDPAGSNLEPYLLAGCGLTPHGPPGPTRQPLSATNSQSCQFFVFTSNKPSGFLPAETKPWILTVPDQTNTAGLRFPRLTVARSLPEIPTGQPSPGPARSAVAGSSATAADGGRPTTHGTRQEG
jgi:hypothetical protein